MRRSARFGTGRFAAGHASTRRLSRARATLPRFSAKAARLSAHSTPAHQSPGKPAGGRAPAPLPPAPQHDSNSSARRANGSRSTTIAPAKHLRDDAREWTRKCDAANFGALRTVASAAGVAAAAKGTESHQPSHLPARASSTCERSVASCEWRTSHFSPPRSMASTFSAPRRDLCESSGESSGEPPRPAADALARAGGCGRPSQPRLACARVTKSRPRQLADSPRRAVLAPVRCSAARKATWSMSCGGEAVRSLAYVSAQSRRSATAPGVFWRIRAPVLASGVSSPTPKSRESCSEAWRRATATSTNATSAPAATAAHACKSSGAQTTVSASSSASTPPAPTAASASDAAWIFASRSDATASLSSSGLFHAACVLRSLPLRL
mmetsp:Transcript_14465/g.48440  ORF Transcript_14465/g.48440 Transcript_14465/m.48440 type:complete len:382 (+) Transcript_14465:1709-2854(+)